MEEYTITPNHHLSFFQKSYVKAESISMGLPFAGRGLRIAYCVHSQWSELSLRIKKNQFAGKYWCMSIAPRSAVWSRNFFFITAGWRAWSRLLRQQVGRSRIVRAPFIEIASGRLNSSPYRPQAIVFAGFSKNSGKPAGAARAICSSINIYAVVHITRA